MTAQLDIAQMIDLACGTPESGVLNLNVLHGLLHILNRQLALNHIRVEFGNGCAPMESMVGHIPAKSAFNITEYQVLPDTDDGGKLANRVKIEPKTAPPVDCVLVLRRNAAQLAAPSTGGEQYPRPPIEVPRHEDFRQMQDADVPAIRDALGPLLPGSAELVHDLGGEEPSRVDNMYEMLNMAKRLDATEITVKKLIGMMNDMGREYTRVSSRLEVTERGEDITNIKDQLDTIEHKLHTGSMHSIRMLHEAAAAAPKYLAPTVHQPSELPAADREELAQLKSDLDYMKMAVQKIALCSGQKDIANYLTKELQNLSCPGDPNLGAGTASTDEAAPGYAARDEEMTNKLRSLEKSVEQLERRLVTSDKRVYDLEKEFGEINDRIEDVLQSIEARSEQEHDTAALYAQLNELKAKCLSNSEKCNALSIARDVIQQTAEELAAKCARLEQLKMDREEVDELLAEKADYNMVQRKVSTDHFDATKRELGHGLHEALAKIGEQEANVQRLLAELGAQMLERITRADLDRMRDQIATKMQAMQERMKALSAARREPEAAATKSKFLRDVQCLSCEQKVVMRREEPAAVARGEPMVSFKSMKPLLTFELDAVRREIGQGGNSRNMHHFEQMYKGVGVALADKAHLCARYCGGSHTAIGAQENFQKRNLPRSREPRNAAADNLQRGNDGTLYKAGQMEACNCADDGRPLPPVPGGMMVAPGAPAVAVAVAVKAEDGGGTVAPPPSASAAETVGGVGLEVNAGIGG